MIDWGQEILQEERRERGPSRGSLTGVLTLYATERDACTEAQGRLLQMVAPQIAQALNVARQKADQPHFQTKLNLRVVSNR